MATDIDSARYISFSTLKNDGSVVASPVWVVPFNGGYAFNTGANSFKVKRLRNNPSVSVARSNFKGAVKADAKIHQGTATVGSEAEHVLVNALVRAKYALAYPVLISSGELWRKLRGKPADESVVILITLTD